MNLETSALQYSKLNRIRLLYRVSGFVLIVPVLVTLFLLFFNGLQDMNCPKLVVGALEQKKWPTFREAR